MTDEERQQRQIEIDVVQKVFGIKKIHYQDWDEHQDFPYFIPSNKPWRTHHNDAEPVPNFLTSGTADYQVLVRVRATWTWDQQDRFAVMIVRLWQDRDTDEESVTPNLLMNYQIGDYSRAALAALAEPTP